MSLKIKLNKKQVYETNSVKYFGITIDKKLNWKVHIDNIAIKLIRANALFYKVRNYVNTGLLKSVFHALFQSHIHYACIILGQNACTINCLFILQMRALRLIYFKEPNTHTSAFFSNQK